VIGGLPAGLAFNGIDTLVGTPLVSGTFPITFKVTDLANGSATKTFSLTIAPGPQPFPFQLSALELDFVAPKGGAAPPAQSLTLQSQTQQTFQVSTDGGNPSIPVPAWLNVIFQGTSAPYRINVSANQGSLAAGVYTARILVRNTGASVTLLVATVNLTVAAAAPQLSSSADKIEFTSKITTPGVLSQTVQLSNTGGGGAITFAASVVNQSTWIKGITPLQGQTGPASPATVRIDIDTGGLPLGYQRDLQEDKEPVFDAVDTLATVLPALVGAVSTLRIDTTAMRAACEDPGLYATDVAEAMVRAGVPFREAHRRTGDLLKRLEADRRTLRELTDDEWAAEGVPEGAALLDPDRSIASRPGPGGPSPASVLAQCDALTAAAGP